MRHLYLLAAVIAFGMTYAASANELVSPCDDPPDTPAGWEIALVTSDNVDTMHRIQPWREGCSGRIENGVQCITKEVQCKFVLKADSSTIARSGSDIRIKMNECATTPVTPDGYTLLTTSKAQWSEQSRPWTLTNIQKFDDDCQGHVVYLHANGGECHYVPTVCTYTYVKDLRAGPTKNDGPKYPDKLPPGFIQR